MRWLVDSAQPSDSQFFYCKFILAHLSIVLNVDIYQVSGHAIQIKDKDGDEPDGSIACS